MAEFLANGMGCLATDVGVDLIEDEDGDFILMCEDGLQGEHDASEFSAGGYGSEGSHGFAWVGGEDEFALIESGGPRGGRGVVADGWFDSDGKLGLLESEAGEFPEGGLRKAWGCGLPLVAELGAEVLDDLLAAFEVPGETNGDFLAFLPLVELGPGRFGKAKNGLDVGAIFASEGLDEIESLGQGSEMFRVDVHGGCVALDGLLEVSEELGGLMVEG